jgi:nucleoid-associated protein YgaU
MEIWLSQGSDKIRLPVNPETLSISSPFGTETIEIDGLGEINLVKFRGVKEITFDSFFPKTYNPSYCLYKSFPSPESCINLIEKWRNSRKPIRLTITETKINLLMDIPDFTYEHRAGNYGDIFFSITLTEHKDIVIKKVTTKASSKKSRPKSTKPKPKTYTVKKGDCLWKIAKKYYGTGTKWPTIYKSNKKVIGKNPNLIYPGQKLVIP